MGELAATLLDLCHRPPLDRAVCPVGLDAHPLVHVQVDALPRGVRDNELVPRGDRLWLENLEGRVGLAFRAHGEVPCLKAAQ
eukprot:10490450-Alexandrium_andersonii.AAC.1